MTGAEPSLRSSLSIGRTPTLSPTASCCVNPRSFRNRIISSANARATAVRGASASPRPVRNSSSSRPRLSSRSSSLSCSIELIGSGSGIDSSAFRSSSSDVFFQEPSSATGPPLDGVPRYAAHAVTAA